jgi:hypothetical protein
MTLSVPSGNSLSWSAIALVSFYQDNPAGRAIVPVT